MWPVAGLDARKSLGDFMTTRLGLSNTFLSTMRDISIKRIQASPSSKVQSEVVVVFASPEIRDTVKRAARELQGDPNSGVRLEIPTFLQSSLKALETVSFAIKRNNPKLKRNVLFDDEAQDLFMDYCLDPEKGLPWKKLRPHQAKKASQNLPADINRETTDDDLQTMLAGPAAGSSNE